MSERREATRRRVFIGGRIVHSCILSDTNCILRNLSPAGARVVVSGTIPLPDRFAIVVDSRGTTRAVETVWRSGDEMGVRFVSEAHEREGVGMLEDSLRQSRAELARLRARIAEIELQARPAEWALH
ncbi:PilZ domain-containing protein [Methylobacterium haplocladii]|uniref:PilZ domain-containing protein n=1 Tax=Methylobacterium haplocladii TaxID=1176176 RepID=A0A512IKZ2_9HYPH|nr:PilZ domain-containing protein [Methylobacterium haplocladii]GEO98369.1 hypothetical protein MHA02_07570 [Methylobacterium haplocladii]GJD82998.1 hypothetical protein HPGCJGGD_0860 [Methylobacterium haplocladii]GLS61402.1 hypothetical protein GCM10007887_41110 [Methylobacterium haplocladii]